MAKRYILSEADRDKVDALIKGGRRQQKQPVREVTPRHWHGGIPFENTSGETIPAFAVMQCDDAELDRERPRVLVVKPTATGTAYLLNGPGDIPEDGGGVGFREGRALQVTGSGDGNFWSPVPGEWELESGGDHFRLIGELDDDTGFFLLTDQPFSLIRGTLVGAMGTGDATWTADGIIVLQGADPRTDPTSTSEAVTFHNIRLWAGDDDASVDLLWNKTQARWEVFQLNCPE